VLDAALAIMPGRPSSAALSPSAAAALVGDPDPSTIIRWVLRGVKHHGIVIRLAATKCGGRWRVKREDLAVFIAAINPPGGRGLPMTAGHGDDTRADLATGGSRTDREERRRHRAALRRLKSAGILT
jgi:hypothetical protein